MYLPNDPPSAAGNSFSRRAPIWEDATLEIFETTDQKSPHLRDIIVLTSILLLLDFDAENWKTLPHLGTGRIGTTPESVLERMMEMHEATRYSTKWNGHPKLPEMVLSSPLAMDHDHLS